MSAKNHNTCSLNRRAVVVVLILSLSVFTPNSMASDHADPISVRLFGRAESNLTGLFVFEQNEKLVLVLAARPGLTNSEVDLSQLSFQIHVDIDSRISYATLPKNDEGRTFRYGGWVRDPENISEDLTLEFRFPHAEKQNPFSAVDAGDPIYVYPIVRTNHPKLDATKIESSLRSWVGLRDDPFILHGFSKTNVLAMVVEIPYEVLGDCDDFLVWGSSQSSGKQVDHVGRSLRTMLPRFDFLNQLHPKDHVNAIKRKHESPDVVSDLMSTFGSPFFGIRHYDFEPDVVIFSRKRWLDTSGSMPVGINDYSISSFPNGRRLTDDVAFLMCERGDCLLFEISTADAHADHEVRPAKNGKDFLDEFPYLAAPNDSPPAPEVPRLRSRTKIILGLSVALVFAIFALPWWLLLRSTRKLRRVAARLQSLHA